MKNAHAADLRAKGLFIFGLPGETPETVQATSDFIDSLELDELNISKFSPFYGAPIWDECVSGKSGAFREDWRLMNCLHFTFVPKGFGSSSAMDFLYNQSIQRFFRGSHYQKLFWTRLWQHRWSLWHVLRNLPAFAVAQWRFLPHRREITGREHWPDLHRLQPQALQTHRQTRLSPAMTLTR